MDSGGADSRYGVKSFPGRDGTQTTSNDNLLVDVASKVDTPQEQSVEQLLQSCEEQCSFCEGIFIAFTKLIAAVAGQIMEDNSKCIQELWEFTKELRDQEKNFFSRIELARSRSQHLDEHHVARVEQLEKWRRAQKEKVEGVERLLTALLQGNINMERKQSQGKIEKSQVIFNSQIYFLSNTITTC